MESWPELLAGALAPDDQERCERHLESCPACRGHVERLGTLGGELLHLARHAGDPTVAPADPTLAQVVDELLQARPTDQPAPGETPDLYFLQPANRPGLLGTLGGYEVEGVIGQGGMGIVLKAFEPALHRPVAIKVLSPALAGSATARRRFSREAQAAAAVCHDHVIAVHGVAEADGLPYFVMQYVAGESLQERLDRAGPLEVAEVVRIGLQTASGLAAAHAQGLIHRDIKPANLLLEDGLARVKITDFGLARTADDIGLTQAGVVAGTPEYMAPEQARGEAVDARADLFSLGSVLYACCTGRPPFRGSTPLAVLRRVSDEPPPPVRERNPDAPAWLEAVIVRLMAKDPAERFQSAAEVAALLESYLAHLQQPATVKAPELPPGRGRESEGLSPRRFPPGVRRRLGRLVWPAVLVLVAALGLGTGFRWLGEQGPAKQAQEAGQGQPARGHVAFDFRTGLANLPALSLHGPDAETVARTDAQGLRITLPAGRGDANLVGLALSQRLRGDFDIVLEYELLAVGEPLPQYGAGVVMRAWFDAPSDLSVILGRSRTPSGERFGSYKRLKGPDGKDQYLNTKHLKATGSRGKLRLLRTGPQVQFLVAEEGQDFQAIQALDIGTDDVRLLSVDCQTMYKPIALDVRLRDLVIDADQFPDGMPSARAPEAAPPATTPGEAGSRGWLASAVVILGLLLAAAVALGLTVRRRRLARPGPAPAGPAAAAPSLSFPCPGCGKALKARAELAGKKSKCPQCGRAVSVPGGEPGEATRLP
jgi:hypothetical protein